VLDKGKKASRDLFDSMLCIKFPVLSLPEKKKKEKNKEACEKSKETCEKNDNKQAF